jgi:hypothetical protein
MAAQKLFDGGVFLSKIFCFLFHRLEKGRINHINNNALKYGLITLVVMLTPISVESQTTFNHRYRFDFPAAVLTSIVPTDSCYYASGIIADSIFPYNTGNIFLKLDLEGNVDFLKTVRDTNRTYETWLPTLQEIGENRFAISGYSFDTTMLGMLIVFDLEGDTLFTHKYLSPFHPEEAFISPYGLSVADNGDYLVVFWIRNPSGASNAEISVLRVDSFGGLQWHKTYGSFLWDRPEGIFKQGSGFIIGAVKQNINIVDQNFISQNYIFKIDSLGNEMWSYLSPQSQLMGPVNDIILEDDGGMIIATQTGVETFINPVSSGLHWDKGLIYKLNANRQKVWEVGFRDPTRPNILNELSKIIKVSDGSGYVASGEYSITYPDLSANLLGWIVKASPEGDSIWSRSLRFFEEDNNLHYLYDIKEAPDGGFIMVGQANEYYAEAYPQQAWIIKVDQYGCLVPGCHLLDDVEEIDLAEAPQILIHPNPVKDYLNVYAKTNTTNPIQSFRMINTKGQMIKTFPANDFDTTYMIPVHDYPPGIYFLQVTALEGTITTKKFMISR